MKHQPVRATAYTASASHGVQSDCRARSLQYVAVFGSRGVGSTGFRLTWDLQLLSYLFLPLGRGLSVPDLSHDNLSDKDSISDVTARGICFMVLVS